MQAEHTQDNLTETQCPHCETRFRVTDEQIQVADGYVRCGVCQDIFQAVDTAATDDQTPTESETEVTDKVSARDAFDFFDETTAQSLPHVVPEKLRDGPVSEQSPMLGTVLWSIGSLLLIITLMLEHIWFNVDQFVDVPELEPVIEQLCSNIDCRKVNVRQPSEIELLSRNVYSHPQQEEALRIDVSIRNNARFTQPYPVMQIEFADARGFVLAARRFLPQEYLSDAGGSQPVAPQLEPGKQSDFSFEIVDPGKQAVAYEFSFL